MTSVIVRINIKIPSVDTKRVKRRIIQCSDHLCSDLFFFRPAYLQAPFFLFSRQQLVSEGLEADLKALKPITAEDIDTNSVSIGTRVKLRDGASGDIFVYSILDQWDADVDRGIISYKSPLGKVLMGARKGSTQTFNAQKLEIIGIEKAIDATGRMV